MRSVGLTAHLPWPLAHTAFTNSVWFPIFFCRHSMDR